MTYYRGVLAPVSRPILRFDNVYTDEIDRWTGRGTARVECFSIGR